MTNHLTKDLIHFILFFNGNLTETVSTHYKLQPTSIFID